MTTADMPGALLPIGHLVNARKAVQRYVEAGGQLDAGALADELDELRRLVLDVAGALETFAADARGTAGKPERRAADQVDVARARLLAAANTNLQPGVHGLMYAPRRPRRVA